MTTAKADELHAELLQQVARLRTSEEWLAAMVTAARFHDYSFGNWLLLWAQAEDRGTTVTRPAGYRTWQRLGRQVRKGERGYRILAPLTRRIADDDGDEPKRVVTGFRTVMVFDVAQTDGEPLAEVAPAQLTGNGGAELAAAAVAMIEAEGFRFSIGPLHGPLGQTRPGTGEVIVEAGLEGAQRTKTTVHELAHVLMHAGGGEVACRGRIEVEAESVAYVVCGAAGLDTSAYSVPYVAGWAETTKDPERTMLATAEVVVKVARRILTQLHTAANAADQQRTAASAGNLSLNGVRMVGSAASPPGSGGKEGS